MKKFEHRRDILYGLINYKNWRYSCIFFYRGDGKVGKGGWGGWEGREGGRGGGWGNNPQSSNYRFLLSYLPFLFFFTFLF